MKLYDVLVDNAFSDGKTDTWSIGIFDDRKKADELVEKMMRSIMYHSKNNQRCYVREKTLNEGVANITVPKDPWIVLKLYYKYTGSELATSKAVLNNPANNFLCSEWKLEKTTPVANFSSDCVISYLPMIENESTKDWNERKVRKFHEMWEMLNNYRRQHDLVTLPFNVY